jgi:protein O-GlcNAc transferase
LTHSTPAPSPANPAAVSPASVLPQAEGAQLIALFNAGQHAELEQRARQMSAQYPGSGFVWKVLGTALLVQNKDGREALERAVALLPGDVEALSNLGNLQKAQGLLDEAAASYHRAATLRPDYVAAHYNLGIALAELGRHDEAVSSYRQAIALQPAWADAHYNLGLALSQMGQDAAAVESYRQALRLQPRHIDALFNQGVALKALARLEEAATSYRRVLAFKPDHAAAHCNLGAVLEAQGKLTEALSSYRQAVRLQPDFAAAHCNAGNVLKAHGQLDAALDSYHQALRHQPDLATAHSNLGNALKDLGRLGDAVAAYREALRCDPQDTDARSNLLLCLNYMPGQADALLLDEACAFGAIAAQVGQPLRNWPNARDAHKPLRIGLVSGDLCHHPVGFFLQGVLPALRSVAAERLALYAYATHTVRDALTKRLKASCHGWCEAAQLSDAQLAEQIRADGIDILIDLSGHTAYNRLPMFARKPAPVQASWLGYFATTGVAAIDHFIADPHTLPEGHEAQFTEHIWRLPDTRFCFSPPDAALAVSPLPALSQGHITFGCFNNLSKMNDAVVALWARVLHAVPGSRLMLKAEHLNGASLQHSVTQRFAAHGIEATRLSLTGPSPRAEYLAAYQHIDIGLDPFPFTGGTTTAESLWMGVPVLTLAGERLVARQGVGLLMNAGLPDWVASNADDYVARAAAHASALPALAALRAGLRQQALASPVFDAARFAGHLDAALRGMWVQWCEAAQAMSPVG